MKEGKGVLEGRGIAVYMRQDSTEEHALLLCIYHSDMVISHEEAREGMKSSM